MTFRGSDFDGPQYGWGGVRGTPYAGGGRDQWNGGRARGEFSAGPEAGLRRGEWQWRGHGPDAAADYGWEYRGGNARGARVLRGEAGMGPRGSYEARLAEERGGGLPRGRDRFDPDRMWDRMAGDRSRGAARGPGGYGGDFRDRPPLADSFDRVRGLARDPRWHGDSQRIRRELETGPARTRWNYRYDQEVTRDRGILAEYDGGFRTRRRR